MDPDEAQAIYDSTFNCGICGSEIKGKNKHVDHDHKTGKIRGVLCDNCNHMLGMSHENIELLKKAIVYLSGQNPL